jgi:hypothetical protein
MFTKSLHFPKGLGNQWKILENGLILDKYVDQNMSLPYAANMSILDIFVQDFKAVQETSCSNILTVQDFENVNINCFTFCLQMPSPLTC